MTTKTSSTRITMLEVREKKHGWTLSVISFAGQTVVDRYFKCGDLHHDSRDSLQFARRRILCETDDNGAMARFRSESDATDYAKAVIGNPALCLWPDKIQPDMELVRVSSRNGGKPERI